MHYDLGHRWRKMTSDEWREYTTDPVEDRKLRVVTKVEGGQIQLECGHWRDTALADVILPGVMAECTQCEKEKPTMGWLNGKAVTTPEEDQPRRALVTPAQAAEPSKALVVPTNNGSTAEVARFMPVMDIEEAVRRRELIVEYTRRAMVDGTDYGKIPGAGDRLVLLQPGADKLCKWFGLVIRYEIVKEEDWTGANHGGEPFFYYAVRSIGWRDGNLEGEGIGSCNSWEAKYRWRKGERLCPNCQQPSVRKSKDDGGGWYCWAKIGGCGQKFQDGDPAIERQEVGRKPNPDIFDQVNTLQKMAFKRAKVSCTINCLSASEFTQDVEDFTVSEEPIDIGGRQQNSRAAQQYVAEQKIATGNLNPQQVPWKTMQQMADAFKAARESVGETAYLEELNRYGWRNFQELRNAIDAKAPGIKDKVADCYWHLLARKEGK